MDEIGQRECQELLRTSSVGRVGVVVAGEPEIFTVTYGLDASGAIVFQTVPGSKLSGVLNQRVVFEVDHTSATSPGWSVVVHGVVHQTALSSLRFGSEGQPSWMSGDSTTERISPTSVGGRSLPLSIPA